MADRIRIHLWDRKTFTRGEDVTDRINKNDVEKVRLRFWRDAKGNNFEGTVIEMRDGYDGPSEFGITEAPDRVRRALGIIEAQPKGTKPAAV